MEANDLKFEIVQQPDWISDDEIADILHDAHKSTLEKGMHYSVLTQRGKEVRERIGENGCFFVALLEGKELVGVTGVSFKKRSTAWYIKNKPYAEIKLVGVKSDYKGHGIYGMLQEKVYNYAFQHVEILTTNTAVKNTILINNNLKRGWDFVDFVSWKNTDYYSVVMAKWKDGCPYLPVYRRIRFMINKWKTKAIKTESGEYTQFARWIRTYILRRETIKR